MHTPLQSLPASVQLRGLLLPMLAFCVGGAAPLQAGALEDYVNRPEPHYAWTELGRRPQGEFEVVHLNLVSQQWRGHLWQHDLQVVRPRTMRHPDFAFLLITGDGDGSKQVAFLQTLAARAGTVAAVVTRVPNQPLYDGRREDALIAYTFDQYLKTGDPTWPLLFPMVKSAVKAMDALAEHGQKNGPPAITRFVVAGASKRGWTTWLTGAVDTRVRGIAPMVIDLLNMSAQTRWAEQVYGRQSEKIHDYTDLGLIGRMDDPAMVRLRQWVDPFSYRHRYTLPKLILLGTNDPYWTVDSLRHYWNELPEPKLVFQTPNAGHDLNGGKDATQTLAAFVHMIADGQPLPRLQWEFQTAPSSEVRVASEAPLRRLRLWEASSADRDFRNDQWTVHREIQPEGTRTVLNLAAPERGYRAYMIEAVLTTTTGHEYRLSTEVKVLPETTPYQPQ